MLGLLPVLAHGTIGHHLQRTVLCLDVASAQVYLGDAALLAAAEREALEAELKALAHIALDGLQVPLRVETSCSGSESYLLVVFEVIAMRTLPGEHAFVFELQVGRHAAREYVARYYELPNLLFHEVATGRVEGTLHGQASELLRAASRTLAAAWWKDNPPNAESRLATVFSFLSVAAACLGAYLGWQVFVGRRRKLEKREARP
jgi:hypothetical protein